jgi:hypothetical protein
MTWPIHAELDALRSRIVTTRTTVLRDQYGTLTGSTVVELHTDVDATARRAWEWLDGYILATDPNDLAQRADAAAACDALVNAICTGHMPPAAAGIARAAAETCDLIIAILDGGGFAHELRGKALITFPARDPAEKPDQIEAALAIAGDR